MAALTARARARGRARVGVGVGVRVGVRLRLRRTGADEELLTLARAVRGEDERHERLMRVGVRVGVRVRVRVGVRVRVRVSLGDLLEAALTGSIE